MAGYFIFHLFTLFGMEELLQLPGVEQHQSFHFNDAQQKPTSCELVVNRGQNWVIATERSTAKGSGLTQAVSTLGAAVCNKFNLDPRQLILLTRYAYPSFESYYSLHYAHTDTDFFNGIRLLDGERQLISPVDVPSVLKMLAAGNSEPSVLRALRVRVGKSVRQ